MRNRDRVFTFALNKQKRQKNQEKCISIGFPDTGHHTVRVSNLRDGQQTRRALRLSCLTAQRASRLWQRQRVSGQSRENSPVEEMEALFRESRGVTACTRRHTKGEPQGRDSRDEQRADQQMLRRRETCQD